jgi:hypothetical protein
MKKLLLVALLVGGAGIATSEAQSSSSFRAPTGERSEQVQRRSIEPTRRREIGGIARAARARHPIQMINPLAPAKYYAPPEETVTWEPYFGRARYTGSTINGVILFGIVW